jgi:hypothetical protein
MAATAALVAAMRSAGASSISSPRRPALQKIVAPAVRADSSSTIGSRRFWPTGEMPPAT